MGRPPNKCDTPASTQGGGWSWSCYVVLFVVALLELALAVASAQHQARLAWCILAPYTRDDYDATAVLLLLPLLLIGLA